MEKKNQALTIVDKSTGEVMQLPELMQSVKEDSIVWSGTNMDIRAMLKDHSGHFSIAGVTNEGKSIEFFLLNSKNFDNIKPSASYESPANFTQFIVFIKIGSVRTFATITFGGASAESAREFVPLLQVKGGAIANVVRATIENQVNKKGQKYGIARFEMRSATADEIAILRDAYQAFPAALHSFNPLPNVEL